MRVVKWLKVDGKKGVYANIVVTSPLLIPQPWSKKARNVVNSESWERDRGAAIQTSYACWYISRACHDYHILIARSLFQLESISDWQRLLDPNSSDFGYFVLS